MKQETEEFENRYLVNDNYSGILVRAAFFHAVEDIVSKLKDTQKFCMIAIDIEYFKIFNKWFGMEKGTELLQGISLFLKELQYQYRGIAGYMSGDDFAVFLPNDPVYIHQIYRGIVKEIKIFDANIGFAPILGIYELQEKETLSALDMYDRACLAQTKVRDNVSQRVIYYERSMFDEIEEEQSTIYGLQNAMEHGWLTYYLQPKCNMSNGKIVGAEALVRWIEPERKFIPPNAFIPILEKTGLISKVDVFVWENVCRDLRKWMDAGNEPIPISVNLSRKDIYSIDVVSVLKNITDRFQIDPKLIEIEITEGAYSKDYETIKYILEALNEAGFKTAMDDFGSGYSSLNMLKDVNVDALKIDMNFLKLEEGSYNKGVRIIETIHSMAQVLEIPVIAEGVEDERQVQLLQNIGCAFAQGYYYYRPMPAADFYQLISDSSCVDTEGFHAKQGDYIELGELLENQLISADLLDRMLGAFAIIAYDGKSIYRMKANEMYYHIVKVPPTDVEKMRRKSLKESVHPADWKMLLAAYEAVCQEPLKSQEIIYRGMYDGEEYSYVTARLHFLKKQGDEMLCLAQIGDITAQVKRDQDLELSKRALLGLIHISENDKGFMEFSSKQQQMVYKMYSKILPMGMIGGYCEPDYPLFFASNEIIQMMGYDSHDDFVASTQGKVINTVYIEDQERVIADVGTEYFEGQEYTTTYRMPKKDGSVFWVLDRGRVLQTEDGRLAILSFCLDITEIMETQFELKEQITALNHQNQELLFLNNQLPCGYHRCTATPDHQFLYISNRFLEMFGYTREEIKILFDDKFTNMVHPDDLSAMDRAVNGSASNHGYLSAEYRMKAKQGYIWVIDQSCRMMYNGEELFQGAVVDVTELVTLRNRLQQLMKSAYDDIILLTCKSGEIIDIEIITSGYIRKQGHTEEEFIEFVWQVLRGGGLPADLRKQYVKFVEALKNRQNFHAMIPMNMSGEKQPVYMNCEYIGSEETGDKFIWIVSAIADAQEMRR